MLRKEVLKDNFSERNPKDNLGETPLHFAAQNGHLPVCQLIINNIKVSNDYFVAVAKSKKIPKLL